MHTPNHNSPRETSKLPLAVLRLRGSQRDMGEQFGHQTAELGGWEPMLEFYPKMPGYLLTGGLPLELRRPLSALASHLLTGPATAMNLYRQRHFPEYYERTVAMADIAGVPRRLARHLMVMDVFQNVVGLVGRLGLLPATRLAATCPACCTSLAVWGASSADGQLLHARNFDFPGAGLWDEAPTVVFCEPDEGLRYGYVSTRGVDLPGVTAFNEAGLTLTVHTRYHRDLSFYAAAVIDVGHDIVRRAETLDDAIQVAKEHRVASSWGLLISSAREHKAMVLETSAKTQAVLRPAPGQEHQSCTNGYLTPALQPGEVIPATIFAADSAARAGRAEALAMEGRERGGLNADELQALLGDLSEPDAEHGSRPAERFMGNTVSSPVSVTSVVCDPENQRLQVSVGLAPTGWGPYLTVPWEWDGPVTARLLDAADAKSPPNLPADRVRHGYRSYVELCRRHLACEPSGPLRRDIEHLADRHADEPHCQFLAAIACLQRGRLTTARVFLEHALALEGGAFRRAQYLLWQSRVLDGLHRPDDAEACRRELMLLNHPYLREYQTQARAEHRRPYTRRRLRRVAINMMVVDAE